jgi:uncharacterized protein YndB with AHSA1/START domain
MIDVAHQINAVARRVGARTLDVGEARTVVVSQAYRATLDDLWDACTNPERIPRWFLPVTGELRVGGRYQLEGNASGTIESCDPPNGFTATWEYGGSTTWIELRLTPLGDEETRFELEHISQVDDDTWVQFGPGAVGIGWELGLLGLASHLSTGEAVSPADAAAWSASEQGKEFITLSGRAWGDAAAQAGGDPEEAAAAARRTIEAYTATPPAE